VLKSTVSASLVPAATVRGVLIVKLATTSRGVALRGSAIDVDANTVDCDRNDNVTRQVRPSL
jgi:hypothetical protein